MFTENKYYAVKKGFETGIFETWADCKKQVHGFKGCQYKSFFTLEEAIEYLDGKYTTVKKIEMPGQVQMQIIEPKKQKPEKKNIKLYVIGEPENKDAPGSYLSVLEYNNTQKVLVKSFYEEATSRQLVVSGIIDAISTVKMPCKIQIYTTTTLNVESKKNCKDNMIKGLNDLIQKSGHTIEISKNTRLVKDTIKKIQNKNII